MSGGAGSRFLRDPARREDAYLFCVFTSVAVAVLVTAGVPPVPLTVKLNVPRGAPEVTFTVSVEVAVAGFGLKVPVAPLGRPVTLRATGALKPFVGFTCTV